MNEFLHLISSAEFIELLKGFPPLASESLDLDHVLGRVLAEDIPAPEDMPPFNRSSMDGYAVRAQDTFGISDSEPFPFSVIGEVAMGGEPFPSVIAVGETARIWTGGELPAGTDAVVMEEYTRPVDTSCVEIFRPVAPFENVVRQGEDICRTRCLAAKGKRLTSYDSGILAGLGICSIVASKKPRVALISSGDELVSRHTSSLPRGKIRDVNATTLANVLRMFHCEPIPLGIVPDRFADIRDLCLRALQDNVDMIVVSGGSSIGMRDLTCQVFASLAGAEILAHGIAIRPGKPTILGRIGNVPLVGLPGHITSALVVFQVFIRVLLAVLSGVSTPEKDFLLRRHAIVARNIPSVSGREDYVRVRFAPQESPAADGGLSLPLAAPLFGKSGTIQTLIQSDGLVRIARDAEGLDEGQLTEVMFFS